MSARKQLYAALMNGGPHSPQRSESASALIDAFAHELAERQRKAYAGEGPDEDNWIRTPFDAADLIDPYTN